MFEKPGISHSIPFKLQVSSLISCVSNHIFLKSRSQISIENRAGKNVRRNGLHVVGNTYTGHERKITSMACKTTSAI